MTASLSPYRVSVETLQNVKCVYQNHQMVCSENAISVFLKWALFSFYFRVFKHTLQILQHLGM